MGRELRPERVESGCLTQLKRLFSSKHKQRNMEEEAAEHKVRGESTRLRTLAAVSATYQPNIRPVTSRPPPPLPTARAYQDHRKVYEEPVSSRYIPKSGRQQPSTRTSSTYKHRSLPPLPPDQGRYHREAIPTKPFPQPFAPTSRSTTKVPPEPWWSRAPILDMELPPPEHGASSSLFPKPLSLKEGAPGRSLRHNIGLNSLVRKPSASSFISTGAESLNTNAAVVGEHVAFGRTLSADHLDRLNLDIIPILPGRRHFSQAPPVSLDIRSFLAGDKHVPEKGVSERLPLTPRDTNNILANNNNGHNLTAYTGREKSLFSPLPPLPLQPNMALSQPPPCTPKGEPPQPRRSASVAFRHNTPMNPTAVRTVIAWLYENLSHIPYAITSLSALAMWGFRHHFPTHVSIICPEHCRDVITSWAVATGVVLYPRQRGFGLSLGGGEVRRVRVRFIPAEEFARLRTAGRGRVLTLASLVDVLAGEFMDMEGEGAGEKRVVLGGGISWAVETMVKMRAGVAAGEVRNVGNPLFLEPFVCTFPGSRGRFVKAGLIAKEPYRDRSWLGPNTFAGIV